MPYTELDAHKLGIKAEDLPNIPIVGLNVFDKIWNIKLNETTLNKINFTKELYSDYLKEIESFPKSVKEKLLKDFKAKEVIDNHTLERENYFDIINYSETHNSIAFNYLFKKTFMEQKPLNERMVSKSYEILMRGTSNENEIGKNYRNSNEQVVGYQDEDKFVVQFLPISYEEIEWALSYFISYYNQPEVKEEDLLVKPFIIHGLIATLQMFRDGNTRFGRTFQYLKLFTMTNKFLDKNLTLPALYFSKKYLPYRKEYRDLIYKLAIKPDNDSWNEWIDFNLRRMQDQIFSNESSLALVRTK